MQVQNLTLSALDLNARLKETTNFSALTELVDARAKFDTPAAPSQSEYEALLKSVIQAFPDHDFQSADIIANAWGQLINIFMRNFFHNVISERDSLKFKDFRQVLSKSTNSEKGLRLLELEQDHFIVPSQNAQKDLHLNNLEMTLAFNYAAFEQIINSVYYFKEIDTSATQFCGLSRDKHMKIIDLIGEFAQHQYDFVYDLLWGASDEQAIDEELPPHPATIQRKAVLNCDHLYTLLK